MSVGYKGNISTSAGAFHAPNIAKKQPDTWQSYLRRLGNGLNGVATNKCITEEDIMSNAQHWMQTKYPGPYIVEQFYNPKIMKIDLRLKFANPKQETMWILRHS